MAKKSNTKSANENPRTNDNSLFSFLPKFIDRRFKVLYFTIPLIFIIGVLCGAMITLRAQPHQSMVVQNEQRNEYWLKLLRKSQKEHLYYGVAGDAQGSKLIKSFQVKTGRPGERPTPLPQSLGKKYWKITKKYSSRENPETAPYFLELDIPVEDGFFGPVPYNECTDPITGEKVQCSWELPGYFGLHGINGDPTRLDASNPGSSGCVRHTDEDITYLYNLLEVDEGVRYYIVDA